MNQTCVSRGSQTQTKRFLGAIAGLYIFFFIPLFSEATPTFTKESGVLISSASPQSFSGVYPSLRMYFLRNYEVYSATTSDGRTWYEEPGVRVSTSTTPLIDYSSITACSVLPLDEGGYRMLYSVEVSSIEFRVVSATSTDGVNWANDTGTRTEVNDGAIFVGSPRLLEMTDGSWRMFLTQDTAGNYDPADTKVVTMASTDEGLTWSEGVLAYDQQVGEIGISTLTNGIARLYYTTPLTGETTNTLILSALSLSNQLLLFSDETTEDNPILSTDTATGSLSFPLPYRSTDTFRWRLYYNFTNAVSTSLSHIYSGLTLNPAPAVVTPNVASRDVPAQPVVLNGEIFSNSPTAKLTMTGQSDIIGTSLTRSDDQTITVTFDTENKEMGGWDLVVTNDDGMTGTLLNGVNITFSAGELTLTDNLFRPLLGGRMTIWFRIYNEGKSVIRIYTLDGRIVKTLLNEVLSADQHTYYWYGRNSTGNTVASGTYILTIKAPKLEKTERLIVIK